MIAQIRPAALADWLAEQRAQGADPYLIDVREPAEWQMASVAPAGVEVRRLPMHSVPAHLPALERQRPVACLCHHGGRSMQVALFLQQHGFDHVANIAGGIDAWSMEVDPRVPRY